MTKYIKEVHHIVVVLKTPFNEAHYGEMTEEQAVARGWEVELEDLLDLLNTGSAEVDIDTQSVSVQNND